MNNDEEIKTLPVYEIFKWDDIVELTTEEIMEFQRIRTRITEIRKSKGLNPNQKYLIKAVD